MPNISSKYVLEIACFNIASCIIAQDSGADRIEFCSDYTSGGLTPNHKDILQVRRLLQIPLHVIIRPRDGNFIYSEEEIDVMKRDIIFCKENNIDGVVLGVINSDSTVNVIVNKELIELAKPMSVTFHRAIDVVADIEKAISEIIELGFNKVLNSGRKQNALEGIENIKAYQQKFGEKINIIPGGGIRSNNIKQIIKETHCKTFHSAAYNLKENRIDINEIKSLKAILKSL